MTRVVIVGGVAGGASAATRLRRLDEKIEIIMLDKGPYVSWANCGLPYYIGNVIRERSALELVDPIQFNDRFNIDVRVNQEVVSIDQNKKSVKVRELIIQKEYDLIYDFLILAPGADPIQPSFPGIDQVPVFFLRTIPDAEVIRQFVEENKPKHATIIGGGFIGLEVAENLQERGIRVKIVEMLDQVMPPLDKEMAQFVHQELILNGVCLILEDPVDSFGRTEEHKPYVKTKKGRIIETDMIILSIGIKPSSKLAKEAGLEVTPYGGIIVDQHMRSSDPFIYAVGDAIQVRNLQTKQSTTLALAGPASKQGRIAAENIVGRKSIFEGVLGASVVKVFDLTVAQVGLSEKDLKKMQMQYEKVYLHPNNHAGYYPGAIPLAFKLIFEIPSGKVLGAQIVGGPGSEKRIDVISVVIKMGGTVYDLEQLELTYAPPFGSAKDPINLAGFIAANTLRGDQPIWHWDQLDEVEQRNGLILDVRTPEEYRIGTIGNAINISDLELRHHLDELPKERPIYTFCAVGYRGYLATRLLTQKGFKEVYNLSGGFKTYEMATMTTEDLINACGSPEPLIEDMVRKRTEESEQFITIDASGLSCPGPLNAMIKGLETLPKDKKLQIIATDLAFKSSIEAYTKLTDAVNLISLEKQQGKLIAILETVQGATQEIRAPIQTIKPIRSEIKQRGLPPHSDITAEELYTRLGTDDKPALLIDVRTLEEYNGPASHISGTILLPLENLMENIEKIARYKDEEVVMICHFGMRSMMAARLLVQKGFKDVRNLNGGMIGWHRKGFPVEPKKRKGIPSNREII